MSRYDEDFYNEPCEFEQKYEEFKQLLIDVVKADFLTEMNRLRTENAELRVVKSNLSKIEKDFKDKERQFDNERKDLERKVRSERLSVLMKDFEVLMFKAGSKKEQLPKCKRCDEKRNVPYKTPLGKDAHEMCDCGKGKLVFYPEEFVCSEFRINRDENSMLMWYKMNPDRDYDHASYSSSTLAKVKYQEGMKYEDLERYHTFFSSLEECQKYCDWLTDKAALLEAKA